MSENRLENDKDAFYLEEKNILFYEGMINEVFYWVEEKQLKDKTLWTRFVNQFKNAADYDGGWRGEYWGKMMRGACLVYSYTKTPELYEVLKNSILEILEVQDEYGRISSYRIDHEFEAWDLWCRKYVLLGMQYFLNICNEDLLRERIINSMCRQADYIISKIGRPEDGKKLITKATRHWRGLNSSSILEPIVNLFKITKKKEYLNFAQYIVECGGTDVVNVFRLAYENKMFPYQYPVTKAYEMMSCFEGLLEYYRVTGKEEHKLSIIRFVDKVLESDFTIIGCCGCTHELFDHSTVRQANTTNGLKAQETCVTVTLMKLLYQLTLLTGDAKYVDAFERAFYNAYLGSLNTEDIIERSVLEEHPEWIKNPLPFDSYSPLTAGTRGNGVGGLMGMSDHHYYGCCACIGAAGIGIYPKMALMSTEKGFALNLYTEGEMRTKTQSGTEVSIVVETSYPIDGSVKITINPERAEFFEIKLRIPKWSTKTNIKVNEIPCAPQTDYFSIMREWQKGDTIELEFDMRTKVLKPIMYGSQILMNEVIWGANYIIPSYDEEDPIAKKHIALQRGPLVLAQEKQLGDYVEKAVDICIDAEECAVVKHPENKLAPYKNMIELAVLLKNGEWMHVTDYASAGKLWREESKMAAWIRCS